MDRAAFGDSRTGIPGSVACGKISNGLKKGSSMKVWKSLSYLFLGIVLSCFLAGCSFAENKNAGLPEDPSQKDYLAQMEDNAETFSDSEQDKTSGVGTGNSAEGTGKPGEETGKPAKGTGNSAEASGTRKENGGDEEWFYSAEFDGGIRNICYAGEGRLLIQAESFWLYDRETEDMVGQYAVEGGTVSGLEVFPVEGGYILIGGLMVPSEGKEFANIGLVQGGSGRRLRGWCFDENFVWQKTLALDELFTEEVDRNTVSAAVSPDGGRIVLKGYDAIYVYDIDTGRMDKVLEMKDIIILEVRFTEEGNQLVFSGIQAEAGDVKSVSVYGVMGVQGEDIAWYRVPDYEMSGDILVYRDEFWFPASYADAVGKLLVVDADDLGGRIISLDEEDRTMGVFGSDHGRYLITATSVRNKEGWQIRIYDAASGGELCERYVGTDEEEYFHRTPAVLVCEESGQCIVLNGSDENTLICSFSIL